MAPGVPERRSHDYHRHGTIDLFAALNIATGKVIGKTSAQHRAEDFKAFLDDIDRQVAPDLAVHVICDNLSAHKAPAIHRWLLAHPRFELHFSTTYSSWLNQVERWFAELQRRRLDRGVFCPLDELTCALEEWINSGTPTPSPSSGPRPLTRSSTPSDATAPGSQDQDTEDARQPAERVRGSRRHRQITAHVGLPDSYRGAARPLLGLLGVDLDRLRGAVAAELGGVQR